MFLRRWSSLSGQEVHADVLVYAVRSFAWSGASSCSHIITWGARGSCEWRKSDPNDHHHSCGGKNIGHTPRKASLALSYYFMFLQTTLVDFYCLPTWVKLELTWKKFKDSAQPKNKGTGYWSFELRFRYHLAFEIDEGLPLETSFVVLVFWQGAPFKLLLRFRTAYEALHFWCCLFLDLSNSTKRRLELVQFLN